MPRRRLGGPALATVCLVLMLLLIVGGALIWYRPFLTRSAQPITEIPAPSALFVLSEFPVPPHQQACMKSVTVTPDSRLATFQLRPAKPTPKGGPPVELTLSGPGYRASDSVPGGYPGGSVTLPIEPPKRDLIGTACFLNQGHTKVLLDGTDEARTVSRATVKIDGRPVDGDIALFFQDSRSQSLLARLGVVFGHASNLTDGLIPVWLIWLIAVFVAFGAPIALILAFYGAVLDDAAL